MIQELIDGNFIHPVPSSGLAKDGYFFYRFQEDVETNCLNMKRLWDQPPRNAAVVATELRKAILGK